MAKKPSKPAAKKEAPKGLTADQHRQKAAEYNAYADMHRAKANLADAKNPPKKGMRSPY
jgi:hypothetical protein